MTEFLFLFWFLVGLLTGWLIFRYRARQRETAAREQMRREIRHWQAQSERNRVLADRLADEKKAWSAGIKQGREDVISLVPMLVAAQQEGQRTETEPH